MHDHYERKGYAVMQAVAPSTARRWAERIGSGWDVPREVLAWLDWARPLVADASGRDCDVVASAMVARPRPTPAPAAWNVADTLTMIVLVSDVGPSVDVLRPGDDIVRSVAASEGRGVLIDRRMTYRFAQPGSPVVVATYRAHARLAC